LQLLFIQHLGTCRFSKACPVVARTPRNSVSFYLTKMARYFSKIEQRMADD